MTDQPPIIPNYQLLHPIGAGSSSNVWLAKDRYGERRAIKIMRAEFVGDYHYQRRFEREVEAQQTLYDITSHVPRIFHYDASHHPPYIVMDFVDGLDLNRMIAKGDISNHSLISRLKWIEALTVTLAKAHSIKVSPSDAHGLIHRDIKPSNIRLQGERLYLLDFSISLPSNVHIDTTQTAMTIRYSAPEGIASESSDVFSLGLVAYEILYEIHPFTTMSEADTIPINLYHDYLVKKLMERTWRLPSMNITRMQDLERPKVKAEVDRVFEKVFALNSKERYQTPIDFYQDLWAAIYPESVEAKPNITHEPATTKIFPELASNKLTSTLRFLKVSNSQLILPVIALVFIIGALLLTSSLPQENDGLIIPINTVTSQASSTAETDVPQVIIQATIQRPSATASPSVTPSATITPSHTATQNPTETPSVTATPSHTATQNPTETPSATITPSHTATQNPTETPSVTATPSHTATQNPTETPSPSASVQLIAIATESPTPILSPTATFVLVTVAANENFASKELGESTPAPNEVQHWGLRNVRIETSSKKRISLNVLYVPSGCYRAYETETCVETGYWIDSVPVSNALYDVCLSEGKCPRPAFGDEYDPAGALSTKPVVGVNWFMAESYCLWRNGRLPSEYEWDFAMTHLSPLATRLKEWVTTVYTDEYASGNSIDDHNTAMEILKNSSEVDIVIKQALGTRLLRGAKNSTNFEQNLTFRCVQEFTN